MAGRTSLIMKDQHWTTADSSASQHCGSSSQTSVQPSWIGAWVKTWAHHNQRLKAPATGLEQYTNRGGSNPWCKYNDGSKVSLVLEDSKTISFKKLLFSMDLKLFSQLISMSDLVKDSRLKWALATSCTWVRQEPVHKQQVRHQLTRTYSTDIRMEIRLAICGTLVAKTIWGEEWQDRIHTDI